MSQGDLILSIKFLMILIRSRAVLKEKWKMLLSVLLREMNLTKMSTLPENKSLGITREGRGILLESDLGRKPVEWN